MKVVITISIILSFLFSCKKDKSKALIATVDCSSITFNNNILQIIQSSCLSCHGQGSSSGALTNYIEIKAYADNGLLKSRVLDIQDMPSNSTLTSDQLGQFKCWIDAGAPNN